MDNVPANMSSDGLGATVTMSGIKEDKSGAAFNNPFEMVPTTGKLFKQMSSTFLSVTANQGKSTSITFTNISLNVTSEGGGMQARQEDIDAYNTRQAEAQDNKAYEGKDKE